jgi:signal transduction histidine kinase
MRLSHRASIAAGALLAGLLVTLAILQYRWIGEVSDAERERRRSQVQTAADGFARDFDREIDRVSELFELDSGPIGVPGLAADLGSRSRRWSEEATHPDLIAGIFVVDLRERELPLHRFDPESETLVRTDWPSRFELLRRRLAAGAIGPRDGLVVAGIPAVVVPLGRRGPFARRMSSPSPGPLGILIIQLDRDVMVSRIVPELAERHLSGPEGENYHLVIASVESGEIIHATAGESREGEAPDAVRPLLVVRGGIEGGRGPGDGRIGIGRQGRRIDSPAPHHGAWELRLHHAGAPLETLVARARARNLAISFGALLVIGGSMALMALAARRAERLARQQVEFVAGVTHELNTPIAALRSAGQNLADGVVEEREQVRSYGSMITADATRLSSMVSEVLEFAGMSSGQRVYRFEPVDLSSLVEEAAGEQGRGGSSGRADIVTEVVPGAAQVRGDRDALRRMIGNLVSNAVKYSGGGPVRVRLSSGSGEARLEVEDRGPGIAPEELVHVFEPFYRGSDSGDRRISGSGLGLSIVRQIAKAHGGSVSVRSEQGRGTTFIVRLPLRNAGQ